MQAAQERNVDTIVIGAGMAGLACASRLLDHPSYATGKRKFLVLEARDRIGGRIGAVRVNGNRLDTGANWIHGVGTEEEPNPLVHILPDKRFKRLSCSVSFNPPHQGYKETSKRQDEDKKILVETAADHEWVRVSSSRIEKPPQGQSKDLVIPPKISSVLFGTIWGLIGSLHDRSTNTAPDRAKEISLLQAMIEDEGLRAAFNKLPERYHAALRALPQFVENMEAGPLTSTSAGKVSGIGQLGLLEYAIEDFDGEQVFLQDGYLAVIEKLGEKVIERGHVMLDVEVQRIESSGGSVNITTNSGNFTAKRVICTLPLGVLQEKLICSGLFPATPNLFSPPLPEDKLEAIRSLGFGTLDKIFLVYSRPWWTEEPWSSILKQGMIRTHLQDRGHDSMEQKPVEPDSMWGFTNELPGIEIHANGEVIPGLRALSVINLHALTGYPVLSCFVSCANAIHIELLTDAAAGALVHRSLTAWFGQEPPACDATYVTRWAQDKFSRGSYSHMIAGLSETKHRECFQDPIISSHGTEIRFAGEHTSRNHFATVHGALLSGWREADAILQSEESQG